MDQEELNTQLYEKMVAEQKTYREQLLLLPPEIILDNAAEYVVREDIVLTMEDADLTPRQCRALLKSDSPLADVYEKIGKRDNSDYMEMVADAVECRANEIIRDDFKRSREEAR